MKRSEFMCAAATALAGSLCSGASTQSAEKMNLLFLFADDLGWSGIGCYGSPYVDTPNLDRLVARGMLFTDAYASAPTCTPSRYALMTGQHPARTGITNIPYFNQWIGKHWPSLPLEAPHIPDRIEGIVTIAHTLRKAGYATGQWGKWHMGNSPEEFGFDVGAAHKSGIHDFPGAGTAPNDQRRAVWDKYLNEFPDLKPGEYARCELVEKAVEFITAHQQQPWFYYYDPLLVHTPILNRQKWLIDKYTERFEREGVREINPTYAAMTETLDWTIGQILEAVERTGQRERTIVIFTSDNGAVQGLHSWPRWVSDNHPLYGGKVTVYEGGIRVPLIVDWPGVTRPGSKSDAVVQTIDFYPTLAEIAGAPLPEGQVLDGESLVPVLSGTGSLKRESVFWHFPHFVTRSQYPDDRYTEFVGVLRHGDWKLLMSYADESLELYNLREDIGETCNLAAREPARAAALREELKQRLRQTGATLPGPNPNYKPTAKR